MFFLNSCCLVDQTFTQLTSLVKGGQMPPFILTRRSGLMSADTVNWSNKHSSAQNIHPRLSDFRRTEQSGRDHGLTCILLVQSPFDKGRFKNHQTVFTSTSLHPAPDLPSASHTCSPQHLIRLSCWHSPSRASNRFSREE